MVDTCALMDIRTSQAIKASSHPAQPTAGKDEMALERFSAPVAFEFLSAACTTALPSTVS